MSARHNIGLPWTTIDEDSVQLTVDLNIYCEEAVLRTCYLFTDRCYLFLASRDPRAIVVEFRSKVPAPDLAVLVGDFGNEMIDQQLRCKLATETRAIRELIVAQAFAEADFQNSNA
jgi:His-Xaa-Ser system protein HxsD